MNKARIKKAAKLYSLSLVALKDLSGTTDEVEEVVVEEAIRVAREALERMGHSAYGSLEACIEAVK